MGELSNTFGTTMIVKFDQLTATGEAGAAGEVVLRVVPAEQRVGLTPVTTQRHLVVDRTALVPLQVPLLATPITAQLMAYGQRGEVGGRVQ